MQIVSNIFTSIFIVALFALPVALFRPSLFKALTRKELSRKQMGVVLFAILSVSFIAIGSTSQEINNLNSSSSNNYAGSMDSTTAEAEKIATETKDVTEIQIIEFSEQRIDSSSLANGQEKVVQEGKNGEKVLVYSVTYVGGQEAGRELKSETIVTEPTDRIVSVGTYTAPSVSSSSSTSSSSNSSSGSSSVYYKNCDAARAAGVTPIYEGQPGYAAHLDRDDDGIACE